MTSTSELTVKFLNTAQQLAERILDDLGQRDPEMAASVVQALQQGEHLALSFIYNRSEPRIVLDCCSDYDTRRSIASIPLPSLTARSGGH